jgi:uncharacterized protein with HEPN domain
MSSERTAKAIAAIESARENIALIRKWAEGRDLATLKSDTIVRYAIERAFIAIASAVRDIPEDLLSAYAIPAGMIAGFRNVLAHTYDDIMDERVILTIRDDLPALDAALETMQRGLMQDRGGK